MFPYLRCHDNWLDHRLLWDGWLTLERWMHDMWLYCVEYYFLTRVLFPLTVQILTVIKTAEKKNNIFLLIAQCISVAMVLTDFYNHQINASCAGKKKLLLFVHFHHSLIRSKVSHELFMMCVCLGGGNPLICLSLLNSCNDNTGPSSWWKSVTSSLPPGAVGWHAEENESLQMGSFIWIDKNFTMGGFWTFLWSL